MTENPQTAARMAEAVHKRHLGWPIEAICRRYGISQTTFYRWHHRHDGLEGDRQSNLEGYLENYLKSKAF